MPVTGLKRYIKLFKNFKNPGEYLLDKLTGKRKPELFMVTKPNEISFAVPKPLHLVFKEIFLGDVYDIDQLVKELPNDPVIIDIGANGGYFNVLLLSKIDLATIYAYEPMPNNVAYLRQLMEENPVLKSCIHLHEVAVIGGDEKFVEFFMEASEKNQVGASVIAGFNQHNTKKIRVESTNLKTIIESNKLTHIDLLKIDCEGAEYGIFYQADQGIFSNIKMLIIETHEIDDQQNNFEALKNYVEQLGFSINASVIDKTCQVLKCINQKME